MPTVHRSACPYDCPDCCGLLVEVEGGRAVAVRGDPDHAWSRGTLCPKMNHYEATVHAPSRLTTPLLRDGPKGSGRFRPAGWDEAIALVASRWKALIAAHGAECLLPYSYAGTMGLVQRNAGHAFFHALGASRLDRTICSPAKGAAWKAVMGETAGMDPEEVAESDFVVVWGLDPVATNIHLVARLKAARARGARVLLVETYRTASAHLADEVLLVRPASDGALALGVLHVLERDGLVDRAFVDAHVQGWGELARQVLPEWTPARTAAVTGLAEERVVALAHALGEARAPFIRVGNGLSRHGNGSMNLRAIACLPAALGAWAKRGGGALFDSSASKAFDTSAVTREDLQPGPTRLVNMNQLGHALTELDRPRVMSLYVYHSNPAAVAPDQNRVLAGLLREDLFTVVHERFLTDTARHADVVLPAASSLEADDLFRSYGQYVIQRTRPVVAPVGEAKPNWDVFRLLARAMGLTDPFFELTANDLVERLLAPPSPWREGLDRAALDEGRPLSLKLPPDVKLRFRTPSGKIEILNPSLAQPLPVYRPPHTAGSALPLRLMTAPSVWGLNSSFLQERADLQSKAGPMALRMSLADAERRGLAAGARVVAWNELGEVTFTLEVTDDVPAGVVVAPGVRRLEDALGARTVNALTSQRLTDEGEGSTFYDTAVDVRAA
ncbi:molybdopterin-dependent oxidoreductase [Anaeromyxobacter diazotrophicus]|uniref:Formate dehydrogenase n=1 Tax=Anaeromyxobacter diazotrophicus TaxID=2590199 RepID=A0A7I9VN67_9BACT|nr:molybdopterin-dependent oxidoreductase [Anaeromyxobacter diazotrophicus]GEJ57856.1 formate dehydrogenase [Anaeromyxobacter diazotrophicus]